MGAPAINDASSVLAGTDVSGIDSISRGDYTRAVEERLPRDYVMMYHPDGTSSLVQLPPLPLRGNKAKVVQERQQKILHYVMNKKKNGEQWWFPSKPANWEPSPLPLRCPVTACDRRGGLPDLLNLWRHIHQKHPGEKELYQGVLNAIKRKMDEAIPEDLQRLLASDAPVASEEELQVARQEFIDVKFEDAQVELDGVPSDTFLPVCEDCGKQPPADHKNPDAWLNGHRGAAHQKGGG